MSLLPEQRARVKIDQMLRRAGWSVVRREAYTPTLSAVAIEEGLLQGNQEADYLLFLEGKAIGVLEAKKESTALSEVVASQAERYTQALLPFYQFWETPLPLVYLSNGKELLFRNQKDPESTYQPLSKMHTPKQMAELVGIELPFVGLPTLAPKGLRACQYEAITHLEASFRSGCQRALIVLATGAGKTFTACLIAYRFLTYTKMRRVLFLVDRNNLGRQAAGEFGDFRLTETGDSFNTIYLTDRLTSNTVSPHANLVICTIQRLFAVISGQELRDSDDDEGEADDTDGPEVYLPETSALCLPPDFFDLIIVDECHRSIYGRWRKVLEYFDSARVIGLTATPGPETMAFFGNNRVVNYTLERSIADGINVDHRVYSIETAVTTAGGVIGEGEAYREITLRTQAEAECVATQETPYLPTALDRSIVNPEQIRIVLEAFKSAVYTELYPERTPDFASLPKTLIFAKSDAHADRIVEILRTQIFPDQCPEFVQKITYSAGNTDELIRNFRQEKAFRIAVTVTLVATGTDVKPLEILLFMRDVNSETLYVQMRGRGCRTISDEALRNVTPNAHSKDLFYLVDAVGVTKHAMSGEPTERAAGAGPNLPLEQLLEQITHGHVIDSHLRLLAGRLARINNKATEEQRTRFFMLSGVEMKELSSSLFTAFDNGTLTSHPFIVNGPNLERKALVAPLTHNPEAREWLLILNRGFLKILQPGSDALISQGFSVEEARETTNAFEAWVQEHRDRETALRIIAQHTGEPITHAMLVDLAQKLQQANFRFQVSTLWAAYHTLHPNRVTPLTGADEREALTNLIQLIRFVFNTTEKLRSLVSYAAQRFELWCGQMQQGVLTSIQRTIVLQITNYIICNGACSRKDLVEIYGRQFVMEAVRAFHSPQKVDAILGSLSHFMLAV